MVLRYGAADLRASAHFGALCGRRARYGAAAAEAAGQAADIDEIHDERNAALIAAGGKHSRLLSPEEMSDYLATSAEQPTVTVDKRATLATVPAHRPEDDSQVYAGTLAHGIDQVVGEGACGVVVDRHSEQPVMIEGSSVRGGGSPVSIEGADKHDLPVAVLVDEVTDSFGVPTAGYTTGNVVVAMPDQAQMILTVAQVQDRTGAVFNDTPIQPDEVTGCTPSGAAPECGRSSLISCGPPTDAGGADHRPPGCG